MRIGARIGEVVTLFLFYNYIHASFIYILGVLDHDGVMVLITIS
jgi:hypothetical protein